MSNSRKTISLAIRGALSFLRLLSERWPTFEGEGRRGIFVVRMNPYIQSVLDHLPTPGIFLNC